MPELIEVEGYRLHARRALGRVIADVDAPDLWFLKGGISPDDVRTALVGRRFVLDRRIGKLLLLDTDGGGPTLGLRFGMTGRLLVDGTTAIERLEYASQDARREWDRFTIHFADGGDVRVNDPRRLGAVELDPDESRLGVDAASITPRQLVAALGTSTAPLKARLMDQAHIAGLGNLLTDETLWRAGLDPARPAGSLSAAERRRLHRHLLRTVDELTARGGSHLGELQVARVRGSICPKDGAPLLRRTIGGRTTYSCPRHQT